MMCRAFISRHLCPLLLLVAVSLLGSCNPHGINDDVTPLVAGTKTYSLEVEGRKSHGPWWEAFNDVSLDGLMHEALSGSLTLKQSVARMEQAMATEKKAGSFLYPEISGTASGDVRWEDKTGTEDHFAAGLGLSWEIDIWHELSSAEKAAGYEVRASREDLEAAALLLTAQVAETYFQIIEANLQVALLDRQITVGETLLKLTELRFGYGEASVVDIFQQRQQLAATQAQIPIEQSRKRTLENRLHILLGKSPDTISLQLSDDFPALPPLPMTGVPLHLLMNRPDLRRAYNQLMAIDYRVAEAVADRFPKLQLTGQGGVRDRLATEGLLYSFLLEAVSPLIDWEQRKAEVEKQQAAYREGLARYSHIYLTAIEEVENALWQEQYQFELLKARDKQLTLARANLTETRNRYSQGLTDYLPVLAALQSLQELERNILSERRELISIRILLYRAIGGSRLVGIDGDHESSIRETNVNMSEGFVR